MKQSTAPVPRLLRNSRASGSVVEACVSFVRRSPRKFTSALRPAPDGGGPSSGGSSPSTFGLKLFIDAQASISVPSTEK